MAPRVFGDLPQIPQEEKWQELGSTDPLGLRCLPRSWGGAGAGGVWRIQDRVEVFPWTAWGQGRV